MKLAFAFLLLATPAVAFDFQSIEFRNTSAQKVSIMGVYPVHKGKVIDDNLGSAFEIGAGKTVTVELASTVCTRVEIGARFEDGEEVWGQTDLCRNRVIILHD